MSVGGATTKCVSDVLFDELGTIDGGATTKGVFDVLCDELDTVDEGLSQPGNNTKASTHSIAKVIKVQNIFFI